MSVAARVPPAGEELPYEVREAIGKAQLAAWELHCLSLLLDDQRYEVLEPGHNLSGVDGHIYAPKETREKISFLINKLVSGTSALRRDIEALDEIRA